MRKFNFWSFCLQKIYDNSVLKKTLAVQQHNPPFGMQGRLREIGKHHIALVGNAVVPSA